MTGFKVGIDIPLLPSNPGLLLSRPEQFVLYFFRNYLFIIFKNTYKIMCFRRKYFKTFKNRGCGNISPSILNERKVAYLMFTLHSI